MNRIKQFVALCLLIVTTNVVAASPTFSAGQDYVRLPDSIRSNPEVAQLVAQDPNKVQLLFFFSYGCPACARFDPAFEKWLRSAKYSNLIIYRMPVSFEDDWQDLAKLYFIMHDLNPKQDLSEKIFDAIHKQNLELWHQDAMKAFLVKNGYNAQDFDSAYNSYKIEMQVKQSDDLTTAYKVDRTPTIVINKPEASYLLTTDKADGDIPKFLRILDYVITMKSD